MIKSKKSNVKSISLDLKKNKNIPISVLMPAYNAEKYIAASIKSILEQSYINFEFIILDDASTDFTLRIIKEYAKKDRRIRVYKNNSNQGITKNRNKLLNLAKGKYIAWQDADDISSKIRLEHEFKFMEINPKVGIVGGYLQFIDEKGAYLILRKYIKEDLGLRRKIFRYSPVCQGASMIRKEVFKKVGNYDGNLKQAEDLDMTFKVARFYKLSNLQEIMLFCRAHKKSESMNKIRENINETLFVRKRAADKYGFKMDLVDKLAYLTTAAIKYFPPPLVFSVFNLARNRNI